VVTEDNKISLQPEVEIEEPDVVISPWLVGAVAFLVAWFLLGLYAVQHPQVQKHLTRSVPMTLEQHVQFQAVMGVLALPILPAIVALAGSALVWIAFLRAEWSDRLLFCAAAMLSSTVILGGTERVFHMAFHEWYGSTMVSGAVVTYTVCLLLARSARNGIFAVLSMLAILYALVLPFYATYFSILDIIGGVLFAGAVLCVSFFFAERAGVKPFAATN
jgi:hypothetical protein